MRDVMQQKLTQPAAVSTQSGFLVRLPCLRTEEIQLARDEVLASAAVSTEEQRTAEALALEDRRNWSEMQPADIPLMLLKIDSFQTPVVHRDHIPEYNSPFNLFVAEPVTRAQRKKIPKAQEACDIEWDKLLKRDTWDPTMV